MKPASRGITGVTWAVAFWLLGIAVAGWLAPPLAVSLGLTGALLLVAIILRNRAVPVLFLLFFALGMVRLGLPAPRHSLQHLLTQAPSFQQPVEGVIVAGPEPREYSFRYELALRRVAGRELHGRALYYSSRGDLQPGDYIYNLARVQRVWRRANFSTFDSEEALAARGIHGLAFACGVEQVSSGSAPRTWLAALRGWLGNRIEQRCGDHAALVRSFLLGDSVIDDDTRDSMRRAGLAHLLAVSGLHVFILGLAVWLLARLLLPWLTAARIAMLAVLVLYAALCAWRPSVTRAVLMVAIYTVGSMLQRRPSSLHTLALAAFAVTLWQPRQLFMPGFQLSYLAVLALVLLVPQVTRHMRYAVDDKPSAAVKLGRAALLLAVSSAGIALALAPVTLYHFHSLSFNGVIANVVALPLFSLLLPMALVVALVPPLPLVLPAFQSSFLLLADTLHTWTTLTARLPFSWEHLGLPGWRVLLLLVALTGVVVLLLSRTARQRIVSAAATAVLLSLACLPLAGGQGLLRLTFFHVGMGDMALIEMPDGSAVVIDTGPGEEMAGHVERSALPYMARGGVRELDAVFISHAHDDHYGGLVALCEATRVRRIVVGDETLARLPWLDSLSVAEDCELLVLRDTTTFAWGDVSLRVLHPDSHFHAMSVNDESQVMRLEYGEFSALFTGDAEIEVEEWLLANEREWLEADVLKVPHHGSATSSTREFLRAVNPEYAFIPAPKRNIHRLPHTLTLDRLAWLGDNLFIAGRDGALQIDTDGRRAVLRSVRRESEIVDADLR
ncbi:MAG: DNA internalization-related competence protein ComEC/Rec2 [Candidatus Cloacimonetes bacterium]|nr:DNA internalization-related competence protein ComEC/Rec2 [Candidatus Cloacimonadota bacterium]